MLKRGDLVSHFRPYTCRGGLWPVLLALVAVATAATATNATETEVGGNVTVEIVNALTGQPVPELQVTAKRRIGDEFERIARQTTDSEGRAEFSLDGVVEEGVPYVFFATPYNGGTAQSPDVSGPGLLRFPVGQVPVQVVAGGTEAPLLETRITLKEKLADGSLVWLQQGYTDGDGLIIFDPPGLGSGRVFLLEARSPWDNSTKRSHEITAAAGLTFVVGNAPLDVTLLDAISLEPLPDQSITAYERNPDGALSWTRSATTDEAGRCTFDLDGLGDGRSVTMNM